MHISSDDAAFVLGKVRERHAPSPGRATGQIPGVGGGQGGVRRGRRAAPSRRAKGVSQLP
jgi:hypothetical protein